MTEMEKINVKLDFNKLLISILSFIKDPENHKKKIYKMISELKEYDYIDENTKLTMKIGKEIIKKLKK